MKHDMNKIKAPLWTTVFVGGFPSHCRYVEWGQSDGPPITLKTVELLSDRYLRRNGKRLKLDEILWVTPTTHANRGQRPLYYLQGGEAVT